MKGKAIVMMCTLIGATAFASVATAQEQDPCAEAAGGDRYLYSACRRTTEGGDPCGAVIATGDRAAYMRCREATSTQCRGDGTMEPTDPRTENPREGEGDACYGPQQCPPIMQREAPNDSIQEERSTGSCSETACRHVTLYNVDPERGDDCHEVVCKNVPAVIETVKVQYLQTVGGTDGLGPLLDATPATQLLKERTLRIVKSAAFWCEKSSGSGTPRPSTGCQQVLDTPVADAGFDPFVNTDFYSAGATECSWAKSTVGGSTYVDDDDKTVAQATSGSCGQHYTMYAAFGSEVERYHLRWQC